MATAMRQEEEAVAVARVLLPAVRLAVGSGSKQLEKRLNYLWQAAHACVASCSPAAHQMTASMVLSARLNRVALPADVLDYVCERCAGLLLPTVSADVRVVPMAANAAANRRLAKQRRRAKRSSAVSSAPEVITTALRVTCRRCDHPNLRAAGTVVNKPKSKKVKDKKRGLEETEDGVEAPDQEHPAPKRAKTSVDAGIPSATGAAKPVQQPQQAEKQLLVPSVLQSLQPPAPPSPPRKLLDGPKRKKKKKQAAVDPAAVAAKSSLSSFLQSLRPGMSK